MTKENWFHRSTETRLKFDGQVTSPKIENTRAEIRAVMALKVFLFRGQLLKVHVEILKTIILTHDLSNNLTYDYFSDM